MAAKLKRILLAFIISATAISARADILVYNMKDKNISFANESEEPKMVKENGIGYVILETNPLSASVNIWIISILNYGGVQYASIESHGTFSLAIKEKMMIINGATDSKSVFLIGRAKKTAINGKNIDIAGKLSGMVIWDYVNYSDTVQRDMGCEQVILNFNKKFTLVCKDYNGEGATQAIMTYLNFVNYLN